MTFSSTAVKTVETDQPAHFISLGDLQPVEKQTWYMKTGSSSIFDNLQMYDVGDGSVKRM